MKAVAIGLLISLACSWTLPAVRAEENDLRKSIVKIITTQRLPNMYQPWSKQSPTETGGTGFIIDGKHILTNHHVIAYHSQIYIQPYQSSERIAARLVAHSPQMDLAVLSVDGDDFFNGRPSLVLDEGVPRAKSAVNVYGYPIGGNEMSITEGIVSRVEYTYYYFGGAGLQTRIDAAINPGNQYTDIRVYFTYYVPKLVRDGKVPLTVLRDGEKLQIDVPTVSERERVAPHLKGGYPEYFILGPLTFSTVSQEFVLALTRERRWAEYLVSIDSPLVTRGNDSARFDGEQLVVVPTQVFAHRISKGYTIAGPRVLARVNGTPVKNLAHLVEMLRDGKDEFLEFTFAENDATRFVFRRQEMLDATDEILTDNGIRNQCSATLEPLWTLGQTP